MSMVGLPVTAGFSSRLMLFTHYFNENMEFVVVVYLTANILNLFTIHNLISDLFAQDHHKTFKTVNLSGKIVPFLIFLVLISAGLNPRVFSY